MKLFLTSAGITNPTLAKELLQLAGKPASQLRVAFVPTAANREDEDKSWLVDDMNNVKKLGFAKFDVVDIAALTPREFLDRFENSDILLFGGGITFDLLEWMRKTSLDKELPRLLETRIYVGISAGSIATGVNLSALKLSALYGEESGVGRADVPALGLVDFNFRSHLNSPEFPQVRKNQLKELFGHGDTLMYALDDEMAIKIDGDKFEIVGEGEYWSSIND